MTRDRSDMYPTSYGPLFDTSLRNLSHTTDPQTSREAASKIGPQIGNLQRWALELIHRYPGRTTKELAKAAVAESNPPDEWHRDVERVRQQIGRRLNELEKANLIYRKGTRDGCALWWPAKETS